MVVEKKIRETISPSQAATKYNIKEEAIKSDREW